jgi:hypothetical protein
MKNLWVVKQNIKLYYMNFMKLFSKLGFKIFIVTVILYITLQSEFVVGCGVVLYLLTCMNRTLNIYNDKIQYEYFDIDISEELDKIINNCLSEYIVFNRAYEKATIITNEEENKITKEVCDMVLSRMSNTIKNKLLLYYNEYSFEYVLANKIYMAVMIYTVENNKTERNSNVTMHNENKKINVHNFMQSL